MVDIPGVSIGFIDVAVQTHGEGIACQRPAEVKVGPVGGAFFVILRLVGEERQ